MFGLELYRSLWTVSYDLDAALRDCADGTFDGVEGPVPADKPDFLAKLHAAGKPFIAEITTGGTYVPTERSPQSHLEDFRVKAETSLLANPKFLTVLAGCDHWSTSQSVDFFGRLLEIAADLQITAHIETHRSRATATPWATQALLEQLPQLTLTCDFSHWCCVCERLVLDEDPLLLALCANRLGHIHARVGYAQGPQAPHPFAPEYAAELAAHERWWDELWRANQAAGKLVTMTPEAGPDAYLHTLPFTNQPVADLNEINRGMAQRQRQRFLNTYP